MGSCDSHMYIFLKSSPKDMLLLTLKRREKNRERVERREKYHSVASHYAPQLGSNQQPRVCTLTGN